MEAEHHLHEFCGLPVGFSYPVRWRCGCGLELSAGEMEIYRKVLELSAAVNTVLVKYTQPV